MAVHVINDNFEIRAPKPVDTRQGYWDDALSAWKPFNDRSHALSLLVYRAEGLTAPVMEDDEQVEYWFVGGIEDEHFILKTTPSDGGAKKYVVELTEDIVIDWAVDILDDGKTFAELLGNSFLWSAYYTVGGREVSYTPPIAITRAGGDIVEVEIMDVNTGYIVLI